MILKEEIDNRRTMKFFNMRVVSFPALTMLNR